jgi:molecular chaperone GrpE (heat shock protein)
MADSTAPDPPEDAGVVEIPLEDPAEANVVVAADVDDEILTTLTRIEERLAESQRLIDRQADIAAKLHAENQALRSGELRTAQAALVTSVIRVHDDVLQMAAGTAAPERRRDLELVADTVADALSRVGIDGLAATVGEPLDPARHRIVEVRETSDPAADRTVAAVLRVGFAWTDGTTVRLTDVAVHRHVPPPEGDADRQADSNQ